MSRKTVLLVPIGVLFVTVSVLGAPEGPAVPVGVAKIDITPDHPVRLSGYAVRTTEASEVEQRLWAKALAIGSDADGPALLINFETCVIPGSLASELARRLEAKAGIARSRLALCCTHTHSAPYLAGALPTMYGAPIPADHQERIERYTKRVIDDLEKVGLAALADRRPARLSCAQGEVTFARNRRLPTSGGIQLNANAAGPADHALPLLRAVGEDGRLLAVVANYACHCTTLGGEFQKVCGDWAGYAQEYVEAGHPGATCIITIGCGGDANPEPRLTLEHAKAHGRSVAAEFDRLLGTPWRSLPAPPVCRFETIRLPLQPAPSREEWEARVRQGGAIAYQARLQLEQLDRGEPLQSEVVYPVQSWSFGNDLVMVLLGGEVVVDYALRLKRELGDPRLWITAYANEVPCYIPSRRILGEGGYEAVDSMIYYNRPASFEPAVEDLIVNTVVRLTPTRVRVAASRPS